MPRRGTMAALGTMAAGTMAALSRSPGAMPRPHWQQQTQPGERPPSPQPSGVDERGFVGYMQQLSVRAAIVHPTILASEATALPPLPPAPPARPPPHAAGGGQRRPSLQELQQLEPRRHLRPAREWPSLSTGAGGDHGIDHTKNWLRFTYVFIFPRSHYPPPAPLCSSDRWQRAMNIYSPPYHRQVSLTALLCSAYARMARSRRGQRHSATPDGCARRA
jgi:hypothetical protein